MHCATHDVARLCEKVALRKRAVNGLLSVQSLLGSHMLWQIAQWSPFCSLAPCIIQI